MLTLSVLNVATPFCGVTVSVPARPVPLVRASVTGLVAAVTVLPLLSSIATVTAGAIVTPAVALEGCCRNASLAATGVPPPDALMVNFQSIEFTVVPNADTRRVDIVANPAPVNLTIENRIRFAPGRCTAAASRPACSSG